MRRASAAGTVRAAAVLAVLAGVLLGTSSAAPASWGGRRPAPRLDLVSSAQPSPSAPSVRHAASSAAWSWRSRVAAHAVATSSADCAGCRGEARTVQLVYAARARTLRVDNVAVAWSSCTGCGARAVSVQLVLTHRRPERTDAHNRALALNASCTGCTTSAVAYQLVLATRRWPDPSALRAQVRSWLEAGTPTPGPAGLDARRRLRDLAGRVVARTQGRVLHRSVRVRVGR